MKPQAFIFDVDNTIADCSHRLHFLKPTPGMIHFPKEQIDWKPDWDAFYDACDKDEPITSVMLLLASLVDYYQIIFVTGHPERIRDKTYKWLNDHVDLWDADELLMRKDGDHRPDYQVKREIYETQIKDKYDVIGVFEDRDQCVQMWRELGLQCYQVNKGNY